MIEQNNYRYIRLGKASVLVDGQFGSTGKGLFAAYLAEQPQNEVDWAVTNSSANAGHTTKYQDGRSFVCYHLPTFGIIQRGAKIYLNAGAIISPDLLLDEIDRFNIKGDRLFIHPMAAVITREDITKEENKKSMASIIASTQKGVGQALANKITRSGKLAKNEPSLQQYIKKIDLNEELLEGARVSIEVPQGFSLSINGPFYPHCTSRNCTVMAGLNDADINPAYLGPVAMTLRTYPIRVGHIVDKSGATIGHSGPVYEDQAELSWDNIGVAPEYTTVTGRQRRIFTWSYIQFHEALSANRPDILFLNFMNYLSPSDQTKLALAVKTEYIAGMGESASPTTFYGFGPNVEDVSMNLGKSE